MHIRVKPSIAFQIVAVTESIQLPSIITADESSLVDLELIDTRFDVLNKEINIALEQYQKHSWLFRLFNYVDINLSTVGYEQLIKCGWVMGDLEYEEIDTYKKGFLIEGEYYKYSSLDLSDGERAEEMASALIQKIERGDYSIQKQGGKG